MSYMRSELIEHGNMECIGWNGRYHAFTNSVIYDKNWVFSCIEDMGVE